MTRTRTRTGHYTCQVQRQIKCLDSSTLIFSNVLKCIYLFHKSLETLWLMMGTAYEDNLCLKSITFLAAVDFLTLLYLAGVDEWFEKAASTCLKYLHFDKIWTICNYCKVTCNTSIEVTSMYWYGSRCTFSAVQRHQQKLCNWLFYQPSFWLLLIVQRRFIFFSKCDFVFVAVWKLLRQHDNNDNHHCHYPGEWLSFCRCLNCCKNSLQHVCRDIITHSKVHARQNNA